MISFNEKYLKYKKKYLKIKNQIGGMLVIVTYKGKIFPVSFPDEFLCPKTGKPFENPVITDKGIIYEKDLYSPKSGESPPRDDVETKSKIQSLLENAYIEKEKEISHLLAAAAAGESRAIEEIALKYLSGEDFLEKNIDKALDLFKQKTVLDERASLARASSAQASSAQASSAQASSMHVIFLDLQRARANGLFVENVKGIERLTREALGCIRLNRGPDMDLPTVVKRGEICRKLGWSLPSVNVTDAIVRHVGKDCVLSLASGKAAQETLLAAKGVNIVCTDLEPPTDTFMPVEKLSTLDAVAKWRPYCPVAMLVWPKYISNFGRGRGAPFPDCYTYQALVAGNFSTVIYIGEERGCTGSEQLEDFLEINYNEARLTDNEMWSPNWPGIHDHLRIFVRKPEITIVMTVPKPQVTPDTSDSESD